MTRYSNDPRWLVTKYPGVDIHGATIAKGTRVFYYPLGKRMLQGEDAAQAARDFDAAMMDERSAS